MRPSFPAIRSDAISVCRPLDDRMAAPKVGYGVNLFGGGIQIHHSTPIEVGRFLALELSVPGLPARILALARCERCEAAPPGAAGPRWAIGAEIHWVGWDSMGTQAEIADFLRSALCAAAEADHQGEAHQDQGDRGRRARATG